MFDKAIPKGEGQPINNNAPKVEMEVDITYVERRVPRHLTQLVDEMIDQFLIERGFSPEEI